MKKKVKSKLSKLFDTAQIAPVRKTKKSTELKEDAKVSNKQ